MTFWQIISGCWNYFGAVLSSNCFDYFQLSSLILAIDSWCCRVLPPQVACGLNHTLVVSADGMMVWAFGDGDYGKLGLGNSTAKSSPQVPAALWCLINELKLICWPIKQWNCLWPWPVLKSLESGRAVWDWYKKSSLWNSVFRGFNQRWQGFHIWPR